MSGLTDKDTNTIFNLSPSLELPNVDPFDSLIVIPNLFLQSLCELLSSVIKLAQLVVDFEGNNEVRSKEQCYKNIQKFVIQTILIKSK